MSSNFQSRMEEFDEELVMVFRLSLELLLNAYGTFEQ